MSIKTNFEFPRGEDEADVIKQGQRLSQDLSKNFRSIKKTLDNLASSSTAYSSTYGLNGVEFSQSWSAAGSTIEQAYTFNHNFGTTPSGFIVIDNAMTTGTFTLNDYSHVFRTSWNTTSITVIISAGTVSAGPIAGTFKILVLR